MDFGDFRLNLSFFDKPVAIHRTVGWARPSYRDPFTAIFWIPVLIQGAMLWRTQIFLALIL